MRLLIDLQLGWLREATERYAERFGRKPARIEELVESGMMRELPEEPLGGRYYLDADGEPRTTKEAERLRLPEAAKGLEFR